MSDQKCCSDEYLCDCLGRSLDYIVNALDRINDTLSKKIKKPCDNIEECIDQISEMLKLKWRSSQASCEECQSMAARGLGGTIEFAIACAGVTCKEIEHECSLQYPDTWGKPCKGCGKDPCCCEGGVCVPCPEEKKKEKKYQGWCDRNTGLVYVTEEGNFPPTIGSLAVSISTSETVALSEAQAYCQSTPRRGEPGKVNPLPRQSFYTPFCDLAGYSNGQALQIIKASGADAAIVGGIAETYSAIGKLGIDGLNIGSLGQIVEGVWSAYMSAPPLAMTTFAPVLAGALGCTNEQFLPVANVLASFGLVNKLTGLDFSEFLTPYRYAMHAACRQRFLDPERAIISYLGNSINYDQLDSQFAIAGLCPETTNWYAYAARAKPIPNELANLRLRRIINSEEYHVSMRELGYLERPVAENLFKLHQQLPTLEDIIRLMVRDADDPDVVDTFLLDTAFDKKYGKQLRDWSEQQGVPELFARYAWRAHWTIPSPTQLFEFWRRLRKNPQFGGEDKLWENITKALIQQDILPFWHQHYKAVNYIPLGRIDIRRSYNIGTLKDNELIPAYAQLGYSDETADKLAKFTKRLRDDAISRHRFVRMWIKLTISRDEAKRRLLEYGYPENLVNDTLNDAEHQFISSPYATAFVNGHLEQAFFVNALIEHGVRLSTATRIANQLALKITHSPALKDYAIGLIDRDGAMQWMKSYGMDVNVIERLLIDVDQNIEHTFVINCQRGIKRRYLLGELEKMDAVNELVKRKTVQDRAQRMVDWWDCERGSIGKGVAVSKLCDWLGRGIINGDDFIRRLKRLGYSDVDAGRIMNDCLISINTKMLKQAQKDAKEHAAEDQRAANMLRKLAAQTQSEAAKLVRARNQAAATTARRQRQLMSAAEKITKKCNCEVYDALEFAKENQRRIVSEFGLTIDESLQVIILSAEDWTGGNLPTLLPIVDANARTIVEAALQPPIDQLSGVPITNGSTHPS